MQARNSSGGHLSDILDILQGRFLGPLMHQSGYVEPWTQQVLFSMLPEPMRAAFHAALEPYLHNTGETQSRTNRPRRNRQNRAASTAVVSRITNQHREDTTPFQSRSTAFTGVNNASNDNASTAGVPPTTSQQREDTTAPESPTAATTVVNDVSNDNECEICYEPCQDREAYTEHAGHPSTICFKCMVHELHTRVFRDTTQAHLNNEGIMCPCSHHRLDVVQVREVQRRASELQDDSIQNLDDDFFAALENQLRIVRTRVNLRFFCRRSCEMMTAVHTAPEMRRRIEWRCPHCGHVHCFRCGSEPHDGHPCWRHEVSDPLIEATTIPCIECSQRIGHYYLHGCHHITCPSPNCSVRVFLFCNKTFQKRT